MTIALAMIVENLHVKKTRKPILLFQIVGQLLSNKAVRGVFVLGIRTNSKSMKSGRKTNKFQFLNLSLLHKSVSITFMLKIKHKI